MNVSSTYPYVSHYAIVKGSRMHYIEMGAGDPILLLHGMPAWSYTWRNVLPAVSMVGRAIAPDLMGTGYSDKPPIAYTVFEHIEYMASFIETLNLTRITLVLHCWGSVIGFALARRFPERIKGIVFFESHLRMPHTRAVVPLPVQELTRAQQAPDKGYRAIVQENYLIAHVLKNSILRTLSPEEWHAYAKPFETEASRQVLWQYAQEIPMPKARRTMTHMVLSNARFLCTTAIPKLMLYTVPGFYTPIADIEWAYQEFPAITVVDLGAPALHYPQEAIPEVLGKTIATWCSAVARCQASTAVAV